jgi:hypothetical protein
MANSGKKKRGLSPERLKALRRKYGLGEFRAKGSSARARRSGSAAPSGMRSDMTGSNGTYEVGLTSAEKLVVENHGEQALQGSHAGIP